METLVATVLIVLVFMVSSMVLNSLFTGSMRYRDHHVKQELYKLQYQYQNHQLKLPYQAQLDTWNLQVNTKEWKGQTYTIFSAAQSAKNKEIQFKIIND